MLCAFLLSVLSLCQALSSSPACLCLLLPCFFLWLVYVCCVVKRNHAAHRTNQDVQAKGARCVCVCVCNFLARVCSCVADARFSLMADTEWELGHSLDNAGQGNLPHPGMCLSVHKQARKRARKRARKHAQEHVCFHCSLAHPMTPCHPLFTLAQEHRESTLSFEELYRTAYQICTQHNSDV